MWKWIVVFGALPCLSSGVWWQSFGPVDNDPEITAACSTKKAFSLNCKDRLLSNETEKITTTNDNAEQQSTLLCYGYKCAPNNSININTQTCSPDVFMSPNAPLSRPRSVTPTSNDTLPHHSTSSLPDDPVSPTPYKLFSSTLASIFSTITVSSLSKQLCTPPLPSQPWVLSTPSSFVGGGYSWASPPFKASSIGSTIEPPRTNAVVNDVLQATFIVKLTNIKWKPQFRHMNEKQAKTLAQEITNNVKDFYASEHDDSFKNITVHIFKKGSVIATFTISYTRLNSIQIMRLQEYVKMNRNISKLPARILIISSDKVPNATTITSTSKVNSTSILLKWSIVHSTVGLKSYLVFYKQAGSRFQPNQYKYELPAVTETAISGLKKFTRYTFRVLASSDNGNGVASEPATLLTDEDVPSVPPRNLETIVYSSTRLGLIWDTIQDRHANGVLLGYNVSLTWREKMGGQVKTSHETVQPVGGYPMLFLNNLESHAKYSFKVCGFTSKGCGPWSQEVCTRTPSNVPSQPPSNITYTNFTSTSSVTILWDPIHPGHINGILRGYQVTYKQVMQSELEVEAGATTMEILGPNNRSLELKYLQAHSIYRVKIAGINKVGVGVPQTVYVETCRCPKTLYTNFWSYPPYLTTSTNAIDGIFPNIVTQMVTWACGVCINGHGDTILNMTSNGRGMTSLKDGVVGVIEDIDDVPQVSFPIHGNKDIKKYKGSHQYVHVVDSPGIAFVSVHRLPNTLHVILGCLPLIALVMCMNYISAFIIWVLERKENNGQFHGSFSKGIIDGFWWSFITMTTIGYGDRVPVSGLGRLFGVFWTLIGLVVNSLLVSSLSTSFAALCMTTDGHLVYGSKIAVMNGSVEYKVGTQMNAFIAKEHQYSSIDGIHAALLKDDVRGALIDTYVAADQKDRLFNENITVTKLLDKKIGYGVVLSGEAKVVQKRCEDFMKRNAEEISKVIQNYTSTLEPSKESDASEKSSQLLEMDSFAMENALLWIGTLLMLAVVGGLVWHVSWLKQRTSKNVERAQCNARQIGKNMKSEMAQGVEVFCQEIKTKISALKVKHRQEMVNLLNQKNKSNALQHAANNSKSNHLKA